MSDLTFTPSPSLSTEQLNALWYGGGCQALARAIAASIRLDLMDHQPIPAGELQAEEIGGIIELPALTIKEEVS